MFPLTWTIFVSLFLFYFCNLTWTTFIYLFKYGMLHEFVCHPCTGAMLIFSVSFQFCICAAEASTWTTFKIQLACGRRKLTS